MLIILTLALLMVYSNCMQYIQNNYKAYFTSEKGYFYIKASDYSSDNYIYIHLMATNIMLNSLEYCRINTVPNENTLECQFSNLAPYSSNFASNITHDYYELPKYWADPNFIVFHYAGEKVKDFSIEVECSKDKFDEVNNGDNNSNSEDTYIVIIIVLGCLLGVVIIVSVIIIVIFIKKNKSQQLLLNNFEAPNAVTPNQNYVVDNMKPE